MEQATAAPTATPQDLRRIEALRARDETVFAGLVAEYAAVPGMAPHAAAFISARVAEVAGGAAAYEAERRAQAEWLIAAPCLETV